MTPSEVRQFRAEAEALSWLIVRRVASEDLIQRYVSGHHHLDMRPNNTQDSAEVAFALRHPWAFPCLDAALALTRPYALLHRKSLLMAAVLETSPDHASDFLPRTLSLVSFLGLGAWVALVSAAHTLAGICIITTLRRAS